MSLGRDETPSGVWHMPINLNQHNTMQNQLTEKQEQELRLCKERLPFRIAYAALHPETGEFFASSVYDMRQPNKYAKKGWIVFILK